MQGTKGGTGSISGRTNCTNSVDPSRGKSPIVVCGENDLESMGTLIKEWAQINIGRPGPNIDAQKLWLWMN